MSSKEPNSDDFMKMVIAGGIGVFTLAVYIICICFKGDSKKEEEKNQEQKEEKAEEKTEQKNEEARSEDKDQVQFAEDALAVYRNESQPEKEQAR